MANTCPRVVETSAAVTVGAWLAGTLTSNAFTSLKAAPS